MDEIGGLLAGFIVILGILVFFVTVIAVISYILTAVGLHKMAKNRFIENPWLAWIPVANLYILGKLIGNIKIGSWKISNPELILPIGFIAAGVLSAIPAVGWIAPILYVILYYFALFKLYNIYRPHQAAMWLAVSIVASMVLLPVIPAIFIFMMRNDTAGVY